MKFSFKTRDLGPTNDYPAIGWIPSLPKGTEQLWRQYGTLGSEERPQLVVSGNGTEWQIYLEGMDSGRTDSATGVGGRIIRMSLYLTGTSAEASLVYPLLDRYVNQVLVAADRGAFREAFLSAIKPGDPYKWRNAGETVQTDSAVKVWEALKASLPSASQMLPATDADRGFAAGFSAANTARFMRVCGSILSGRISSTALALSDARLSDVPTLQVSNLVSLLSLQSGDAGQERKIVVGGFSPSGRVESGPTRPVGSAPRADRSVRTSSLWGSVPREPEPPPSPDRPDTSKGKRVAAFFAVALTVLIALLTLLIKSCQNSKTTSASPNPATQTSTNTYQGVHHGN